MCTIRRVDKHQRDAYGCANAARGHDCMDAGGRAPTVGAFRRRMEQLPSSGIHQYRLEWMRCAYPPYIKNTFTVSWAQAT